MNVLLTGATGFLGSKVLHSIINDYSSIFNSNIDVTILKRSFSDCRRIESVLDRISVFDVDKMPIKDLFSIKSFDLIIHCATNYGRHHETRLNILESNLFLPLQLMELGLENGLKYFINTDTVLDKRVSEYSLSKNQFYDWLYSYHKKLTCINVKLEHFYGAFDNDSKFITKIVRELKNGSMHIYLTSGEQKRDFIYIDDVVSAFQTIIRNIEKMSIGMYNFEIGTGTTTSIKDVVMLIKRITGNNTTRLNFGALSYRENELMDVKLNLAPIKSLGWDSMVSLDNGLRELIVLEGAVCK